jgi:hypothetical protein
MSDTATAYCHVALWVRMKVITICTHCCFAYSNSSPIYVVVCVPRVWYSTRVKLSHAGTPTATATASILLLQYQCILCACMCVVLSSKPACSASFLSYLLQCYCYYYYCLVSNSYASVTARCHRLIPNWKITPHSIPSFCFCETDDSNSQNSMMNPSSTPNANPVHEDNAAHMTRGNSFSLQTQHCCRLNTILSVIVVIAILSVTSCNITDSKYNMMSCRITLLYTDTLFNLATSTDLIWSHAGYQLLVLPPVSAR